MKNFILACFSLILTIQSALVAQLPDGTTAPDFTIMDINGNSHNLYDVLEDNKSVIIDFSATWCTICWNYHKTNALENVYSSYGPMGTGEVEVFWIDADSQTNDACVINESGCTGGTKGDWTDGSAYTYFNLEGAELSVKDNYEINSYPTIVGITSNKKQYEIGKETNPAAWQSWIQETFALDYMAEVGSDFIDLTPIAGYGELTYEWNNGATTQDISGLSEGFYSCTITEERGHTVETISFQVLSGGINMMCPPTDDQVYCRIDDIPSSLSLSEFFEAGGDIIGQYVANSFNYTEEQSTQTCPFTFIRSYSIADLSGNVFTCSTEYAVDDVTPPTTNVNIPMVTLAQEDVLASRITDVTPFIEDGSISDDCGIAIDSFTLLFEAYNNGTCEQISRVYTVEDYCGNSATFEQTLYVEFDASVSASFTSIITEATAQFSSTSPFEGSYVWTFGDGNSSTEADPSHTYLANGNYEVCLEITSPCGVREICETIEISGIVTVLSKESFDLKLSPNPAPSNSSIIITTVEVIKAEVVLIDLKGIVYTRNLIQEGKHTFLLSTQDLPSGVYVITLTNILGQSSTKKLVIL